MTLSDFSGQCTHEDFEPLLEQAVSVSNGSIKMSMIVREVTSYPNRQAEGLRVPFVLLLDPVDGQNPPELSAQTVTIEHENIESLQAVGHWVTVPVIKVGPRIMLEIAFG